MKPKGLLFKAEMILALLNTKVGVWPPEPIDPSKPYKGQTRRADKILEYHGCLSGDCPHEKQAECDASIMGLCPYPVGAILYAKETHYDCRHETKKMNYEYRADWTALRDADERDFAWKPSIFMPMKAARIWLEVVKVRVEQVNQIGEQDALEEGIIRVGHVFQATGTGYPNTEGRLGPICGSAIVAYKALWDKINGAGSFDKAPWVFAYDIKRINKPEGL